MNRRLLPVAAAVLAGAAALPVAFAAPGSFASPDYPADAVPFVLSSASDSAPAPSLASSSVPWGAVGHQMAAQAAVEALPGEMPGFFVEAKDQLVWLNPEPDRWRDRRYREMDEAWRYDHYIDLENIPDPVILEASTDRWDFFQRLLEAGVENPKVAVGFAPFAALELYQRLESSFARWRSEEDPEVRRWLEARIVNDAGVLGHFVTDLSQPHHTTVHFNGWDEDAAPNPEGYTTDSGFHSRFESRFVQTHIRYDDVRPRVGGEARVFEDARTSIFAYVRYTNSKVEELYRIDRDHGFGPETPPDPVSADFAADRIAAGAEMLRDLWWSAWVGSEPPPPS